MCVTDKQYPPSVWLSSCCTPVYRSVFCVDVLQLDGHQIRPGKKLKVNPSIPNSRLFVGNIPKSKSKDDIMQEFSKVVGEWHAV